MSWTGLAKNALKNNTEVRLLLQLLRRRKGSSFAADLNEQMEEND